MLINRKTIIFACVLWICSLCACNDTVSVESKQGMAGNETVAASLDIKESDAAQPEDEQPDAVLEGEEEEEIPDYTEEDLVDFEPEQIFSYCINPVCVYDPAGTQLIFEMSFENGIPKSDDDLFYLFEIASYENESELNDKEPVAITAKGKKVTFVLPYEDRYLFERFVPALYSEGEYYPLSYGQNLNNPQELAGNTADYPEIGTKKGILLDGNSIGTERLDNLNVKRLVYNIPLSLILGETSNPEHPTIEYEYNGEIYQFNGYYCMVYDSLFSYLTEQGYYCTAIVLNDWNKQFPEMIHPLSRKRTSRSKYYAFNTEEEDGVRHMEAAARFLAERYSCGEHGMVYDWVIANEINQHNIWNYMETTDLEYYTESFEKSFRTFYNAVKASYSHANVYFSLDQYWNNNGGYNNRCFNGRDILYEFNELAQKHGNYDWGLSVHPYPVPLPKTRFWTGEFDKTEEAKFLTPMNLSACTDIMTKPEFLNTNGEVRSIAITELGFCSKAGEKLQAAAFAYCYYIIDHNKYIDSFLMNRQTDDSEALKTGLSLGIYNRDNSAKYILDVFKNIDTEEGEDYLPEMLEIIGADSLEEALEWAQ